MFRLRQLKEKTQLNEIDLFVLACASVASNHISRSAAHGSIKATNHVRIHAKNIKTHSHLTAAAAVAAFFLLSARLNMESLLMLC